MALLANWKDVLRKAWSVRLMLLAAVLSGFEVAVPLLQGVVDIPPGRFAFYAFIITAAALITRVLAQKDLP